jgi:hypothetical protein
MNYRDGALSMTLNLPWHWIVLEAHQYTYLKVEIKFQHLQMSRKSQLLSAMTIELRNILFNAKSNLKRAEKIQREIRGKVSY